MMQRSSELRNAPSWFQLTSIQNKKMAAYVCLACNAVPGNWLVCVNKGLTYLYEICFTAGIIAEADVWGDVSIQQHSRVVWYIGRGHSAFQNLRQMSWPLICRRPTVVHRRCLSARYLVNVPFFQPKSKPWDSNVNGVVTRRSAAFDN